MTSTINLQKCDPDFAQLKKLESEKDSLISQAQEKDHQINSLKRKLNQKLDAMAGFASAEDSEKIIYTLNSYYKNLHGSEEEIQELINLKNIENIFTWLMAYNYMKVTNPDLIEFEGEEKFVASIYLTFHMNSGLMGSPRIIGHADNKCLFVADDNFVIPGATR